MMESFKAVLTKSITYHKDGVEMVVCKGTNIIIDMDKNIGLVNGDHVDMFIDEYSVTQH